MIITGGGGFLGSQLCLRLLERGELTGASGAPEPIEEMVLLDAHFPVPCDDPRVTQTIGDISDRDSILPLVADGPSTSVFHLASMVSGECEERFDDALRVNLEGGRNVFEAARAAPGRPRVVFASSIACFGGEAMEEVQTDATKHTPRTTYGVTKAICELILNDHTRKGHFDGRTARLPTVIIRPGKPNAAASSWASGMFREPLNGEPCALPVRRTQQHPMTGYRTVVESFIALHEVPADVTEFTVDLKQSGSPMLISRRADSWWQASRKGKVQKDVCKVDGLRELTSRWAGIDSRSMWAMFQKKSPRQA